MRRVALLSVGLLLVAAAVANATGVIGSSGPSGPAASKERAIAERLSKQDEIASASARRGPRGLRGPKGPRGPRGLTGSTGASGAVKAATVVKSARVFLCGWESGACSVGSATAICPPGTIVLSGGYAGAGIRAFIDAPVAGGWFVGAANESSLSTTFEAVVVCGS